MTPALAGLVDAVPRALSFGAVVLVCTIVVGMVVRGRGVATRAPGDPVVRVS